VALLLIAGGLYLMVAAYVLVAQRSLIFPAPPRGRPPAHVEQMVSLLSGQYFVYLPGSPVVVYFHGNGEDLSDAGAMMDLLRSLGAGVLAVEYPGYGASPGSPSERGLYAAAESALRWLRDEKREPNIVLLGQSLGSGVAIEMARRGWGARIVLITPFTSMSALGQQLFPWLPVSLLLQHRFDNLSKAPQINKPVLVLHGTDDEVVPFAMGDRMSHALPHATLHPIPGGQHNDLLLLHTADLRAALAGFLAL
jgi:fermentation-respiration switch protein FrsA (DUF1100 family)